MVVAVELCLVEQDPYNTGVVGFDCAGGGFVSVLRSVLCERITVGRFTQAGMVFMAATFAAKLRSTL